MTPRTSSRKGLTEVESPPPMNPMSPSRRSHLDRYTVRIYRSDAADVTVYTRVKHCWWQAGNTVLAILHYYDDGTYRYVYWLREKIDWYSVEMEEPDDE